MENSRDRFLHYWEFREAPKVDLTQFAYLKALRKLLQDEPRIQDFELPHN